MSEKQNINKILKERALALQVNTEPEESINQKMDTLEFILSGERYAIDSFFVTEVLKISRLTPLPCTPSFILGLINKRGQILSVIDIKKFFNLPELGLTNLNRVIFVKHEEIEFGILTDEIIGNSSLNLETLQLQTPSVNEIADKYILGLTKQRLIVLDIKEILLDKKMIINDEV